MPMEIQLVKIYSCKFCKNMTVNKCVPLFKVILRCEQIMQTQCTTTSYLVCNSSEMEF